MGSPRICVIDSSPVVRETVAAVLSATCAVDQLDAGAADRAASAPGVSLFLIEEGLLPASTVARLVQQTPIVWMSPTPPATVSGQRYITRQGSPLELLDTVASILSDATPGAPLATGDPDLVAPRLDADAAHIAALLANTDMACLISGEPGCGKMRAARALHKRSAAARFVGLTTDAWPADLAGFTARWKGPLTLCISHVDRLSRGAQRWLLDIIEAGGAENDAGFQRVRVLALTRLNPRALQRVADFDRTLDLRLGTMPLEIKPLRERSAEIIVLAGEVARDAATRLHRPLPSFTERTVNRLRHYAWPGNLAELEAVMARSIALCDAPLLDVGDLQFGYSAPRVPVAQASAPKGIAATPALNPAAILSTTPADLIIQELCHEFRNPMSTIKTIGQHLDRLMENAEGREQLAQLTGEAIERMDRVLDRLVRFTEFGTPARRNVAMNAILGPAVRELAPTLSERRLVLNYQPADPSEATADPDQLGYAVTNLLEAVAAELEEGDSITIGPASPSPAFAVEFKTARRSIAESLQTWLDTPTEEKPTWLPLGILLGRSVIEKNGGRMKIEASEGRTVLTVHLPAAKGTTAHGEASRTDS